MQKSGHSGGAVSRGAVAGRLALLVVAYFIGGRIGLCLPYFGREVSLIWPPTGIAVAALLAWGIRYWPGVFAGTLLVNLSIGSPVGQALAISCGNTLAPVAAVWLLRRVAGFNTGFIRRQDVLWFALLGGFAAMLVSACLGTLSLCVAGGATWSNFGAVALVWWLGDAMGVLVMVPPLLTFPRNEARSLRWWVELGLLSCVTVLVGLLGFNELIPISGQNDMLPFVTFPVLIWAALRLGTWGASWSALLLAGVAVANTALGLGPFSGHDVQTGMVLLWAYVATVTVVALLMTALQAERERAESERERLFTLSDELMCVAGTDGRFKELNPAYMRILGYGPEELRGELLFDFIHPDDRAPTQARLAQLKAEHTSAFVENRFRCKDGSWRWLSWSVPPVEAGKDLLYAVARDVTVQKKTEEERQKFVSLADSSLEFIGMCDGDFKPFYVNPAGIELLGLDTLEAACRAKVQDFFFPEDQPFISQHFFPRVLREGRGEVEIRFRHFKTGEAIWMLYHVFNIRDASGAVVSWATVSRNIHARKQAEEERRKLEVQVLRAQKLESLGVMAGGIAHDFNNMLTGILGFSDLARRALPDSSPAVPHVEEVIKEAQRAAEVTQQMLSYSGKGVFVLQPVLLSALIEDMRNMLKIAVTKKCELRFDLAPGLPACEADATQIRQIVMNLVINASEAITGGDGLVTISTGIENHRSTSHSDTFIGEVPPEGSYVFVQVSDTGIGITKETRTKLFDPFFTTKFTGRGLGLSTVLGIVRGHRGAIQVHSAPREGSTFRVLLPASDRPASPPAAPNSEPARWTGSGTVLVVDDEESVRKVAHHMLTRLGFTVLTANDGQEGVEIFARESARIGVVLLDMNMPRLDGEGACRAMKNIRADVRIVFSSGYNEAAATSLTGHNGEGFLQKPYRMDQLAEAIRMALEKTAHTTAAK